MLWMELMANGSSHSKRCLSHAKSSTHKIGPMYFYFRIESGKHCCSHTHRECIVCMCVLCSVYYFSVFILVSDYCKCDCDCNCDLNENEWIMARLAQLPNEWMIWFFSSFITSIKRAKSVLANFISFVILKTATSRPMRKLDGRNREHWIRSTESCWKFMAIIEAPKWT